MLIYIAAEISSELSLAHPENAASTTMLTAEQFAKPGTIVGLTEARIEYTIYDSEKRSLEWANSTFIVWCSIFVTGYSINRQTLILT